MSSAKKHCPFGVDVSSSYTFTVLKKRYSYRQRHKCCVDKQLAHSVNNVRTEISGTRFIKLNMKSERVLGLELNSEHSASVITTHSSSLFLRMGYERGTCSLYLVVPYDQLVVTIEYEPSLRDRKTK